MWRDLTFTNKTHLIDRRVTLSWSRSQLARLLVKGAVTNSAIAEYAGSTVPGAEAGVDELSDDEIEVILKTLLPGKADSGDDEPGILDWLFDRVIDASGTAFPREAVLLGNRGRAQQLIRKAPTSVSDSSLISREALKEAFAEVSSLRVETYLAEFPDLRAHFERFGGKTQFEFPRGELDAMFDGLSPSGTELLVALAEVGILRPVDGKAATATKFEVPRLYRHGLGLVATGLG